MDSVCFFGDEMYLLSDNSLMLKVDSDSLATTAQVRKLGPFVNDVKQKDRFWGEYI